MVSAPDVKIYRSTATGTGGGSLGGSIIATQVATATSNNLFNAATRGEQVSGEQYYRCMYVKNTHGSEAMDNFKWWLDADSPKSDSKYQWAFDPLVYPQVCVKLDGSNDYVSCTNDATLWSQGLTKFSFSIWVFPTSNSGANRDVVRHGVSNNHRFRCELINGTTTMRFHIVDSGSVDRIADGTGVVLNQWNHIVGTYDKFLGSANIKVYVNKVVGGTTGNLAETVNDSEAMNVGGDPGAGFTQGYIKDFRWWTTVALTQTDVNNLYDGVTIDDEPDYWLRMNEGTSNPIDKITTTKVGTLTGGAAWQTDAQSITSTYVSPLGVTWKTASSQPDTATVAKLTAGSSFPVWVYWDIAANAEQRADDPGTWAFTFDIPSGGTGTGGTPGTGGGTGGNPPPANTNFKIAVAGDWGCESDTDSVISLIQNQNYDLVVGVGDNAYSGASCWISRFQPLKTKMISAYGNHEYDDGSPNDYKPFFGHNNTYNSRQFQNVFFILFDTNISIAVGSAQYNFVKSELERVKNDPSILWRVAICHHPWYGSSSSHSYNQFNQRQIFHQLFVDNGVNFVVTGHNHNWQRTHQIGYNSASSGSPNVIDNTSPYSRTALGLIHIVSGTGGHDSGSSLYSLSSLPSYGAYQDRTHNGVWEMVASSNGTVLTCSFVEIGGDKFDTFTIS